MKTTDTKRTMKPRPKLKRLGTGVYSFSVCDREFVVERDEATTGYGLHCTVPVWNLYASADERREWLDDFPSRLDAVVHAQAVSHKD